MKAVLPHDEFKGSGTNLYKIKEWSQEPSLNEVVVVPSIVTQPHTSRTGLATDIFAENVYRIDGAVHFKVCRQFDAEAKRLVVGAT